MKKTLEILLFALLFLLPFSRPSFAQESRIIKEQNGRKCVDLAAYYEGAHNTSLAITGKEQSPMSTRKAESLATLTNIIGILVGDSIYCINDEEAQSKTRMLEGNGLLGMLDNTSFALLANIPTLNVTNHLAQEFVPGYGRNNMTQAREVNHYLGVMTGEKQCIPETSVTGTCEEAKKTGSYTFYPAEVNGVTINFITEDKSVACFNTEIECQNAIEGKLGDAVDDLIDEEAEEAGLVCVYTNIRTAPTFCFESYSQEECDELKGTQDVRFYDSVRECQDNQEAALQEHEELLDSEADANSLLKRWKRWFVNVLLGYLGFGKIDYDRIEADAEQAVTSASGYEYLQNVKLDALWSVTRNIAYLFFVVAMIIIGFMIMFRSKIGGQVMVSVGNSIPRLIVCLLLVTFSFAISGIMLDIGKVSMNVIGNLMVKAQEDATGVVSEPVDIASIGNLTDQLLYGAKQQSGSDFGLKGGEDGIGDAIDSQLSTTSTRPTWVGETGGTVLEVILRLVGATFLTSGKEADLKAGALKLLVPLAAPVLSILDVLWDFLLTGFQIPNASRLLRLILLLVIVLYASIKLFITIVTSYVKIFVSVVLGPIQIALGVIPGNFSSVVRWFKTLVANILVFPTIIAILGFAQFFATAVEPEKFVFFGNKGVFIPAGLITMKGIFLIAGYLFAANAPNLVKSFIKIEENRTLSTIGGSIQKSVAKMPLIGGIFSGK